MEERGERVQTRVGMRYILVVLSIATLSISFIISSVMYHSLDITALTTTLSLIVSFTIIGDILGILIVAFETCYRNTFYNIGYAITQVVVIPIGVYVIYCFPLYVICEVCHIFTAIVSCALVRQNVVDSDQIETLY